MVFDRGMQLFDCLQAGSSEKTIRDKSYVCKTCRNIDFQDLLENPRQMQYASDMGEPSAHTMRYSSDCKLCRLMFRDVPARYMDNTLELRSYSLKKISNWARADNLSDCDSVVLQIGLQRPDGFLHYPVDDVYCKLTSDSSQGVYRAQPVQSNWNCHKARSWLHACKSCHALVCKENVRKVPGMNLIDCKDMVIVRVLEGMRYLGLSYVWGANILSTSHAGYREGSTLPVDISRTIKDAIDVSLQLGYRYLWVDEYCIDQKDDKHRSDQVKRMDQIYRGADLTIVAAAGENKTHGLPGVGSTKRKDSSIICVEDVVVFSNGPEPNHEAIQSKWFTRAW
jgi:hypothetical protein